ncbi:MAG TPA: pantoate--beta-alanine ligase, partial [Xanthomonadales bacterium]|nr:pantoate--beta-alanine ligase [Xanthomonadales bacterium]
GFPPATTVSVTGPLTEILCAPFRPGHFTGVATVVNILFNVVGPDVAVFGQKDYQQLLVVRRLVADLAMPIAIVAGATRREPDGLAMSSRNQYLSATDRPRAAAIHATLRAAAARVRAGEAPSDVEAWAQAQLREAGFVPDYVSVRDATDLRAPAAGQRAGLVVLVAARLGTTRLIDNLLIDNGEGSSA